ncbi:MAG: cell division protein FtsZ [Alphaproteobacteria bacterium]|nr:cell division protein FtsZ [Alphaproteobacteria bacterium]
MSINLTVPETSVTQLKPRIAVIGVGGGGSNAVNNMIAKKLSEVDFIVANTDSQSLERSSASKKIQLGLRITQGLGAGARPEIGQSAAEEAKEQLEQALDGFNMVFITAGMGGGTGSGAAPVVAKIAKDKGILTIGVVTKPFEFEGKKRMEIANQALTKFTEAVDSLIVIPNQNLFRIADKNTTLPEAFVMVDNVLYSGVCSITDLILNPGLINLDFADIKSIMEDKGKAIMGTGEAEGEGRARIAAEQALSNPLLDECSMKGAKGVLINVTGGDDMTLMEIDEAANIIKAEVDEDANIIFGSSLDSSITGKIRVSIVVTGIDGKPYSSHETTLRTKSYIEESYTSQPSIQTESSSYKNSQESYQQENIDESVQSDETSPVENVSSENDSFEESEQSEIVKQEESSPQTTDFDFNNQAEFDNVDDLDNLEPSTAISDAPQATALFNAIINKTAPRNDNPTSEKSIADFLPDDKDIFSSNTTIDSFESEPILFPDNNEPHFSEHFEAVKEEPVAPAPQKTKLIDKILGISRARKNRKDIPGNDDHYVEPSVSGLSSNSDIIDFSSDVDVDNLDIPSFLRRK